MGFNSISTDSIRRKFLYQDGKLVWKYDPEKSKSWNTSWAGKEAGTVRKDGYVTVQFLGKRTYAHRLIFCYFNEVDIENLDIDHINGNHSDNNIENLRCVDRCGNLQNQKLLSKNTTGFKNVHFDKKSNKYHVLIRANNKRFHGGYFSDINDAVEKASHLRKELHKEFANHGNGSVLLTKDTK